MLQRTFYPGLFLVDVLVVVSLQRDKAVMKWHEVLSWKRLKSILLFLKVIPDQFFLFFCNLDYRLLHLH